MTAGLPQSAGCAEHGSPESARELLEGVCTALSDESADALRLGNDAVNHILMCAMADVIDAIDSLTWP